MRFERRFHGRLGSLGLRPCALELARSEVETLAPAGWTAARVESWLDWAEALPHDRPAEDPLTAATDEEIAEALGGGPAAYASRLAAWGWALGLFDREEDADAFRDEITASLPPGFNQRGAAARKSCKAASSSFTAMRSA